MSTRAATAEELPPSGIDALPPDTRVDDFCILKPLGEGSSGMVYLAQDLTLGRRVALKFIRTREDVPEGDAEFMREARLTARFSHPHIVTLHSVGRFGGVPYLAMEYLDGTTLRERLDGGRLSLREALRYGLAIAEALAEAHRHDILHGDLKPENVLLPRDGRPRVLDFGLARHREQSGPAGAGSPAYMAPELWTGASPSAATDVWALGVIVFELVQGARPASDAELALRAFNPRPVELPASLRATPLGRLLSELLALEPGARPSSELAAQRLADLAQASEKRAPDDSPFRGLRSFEESDAADFHGREDEVAAAAELLRDRELVLVSGPSGVGKSSFVQAGLLPWLREHGAWTVVSLRPGPQPFRRLAAALASAQDAEAVAAAELEQRLATRPGEIALILEALARGRASQVLLFLDAFEELFTLASASERQRLLSCLAAATVSGRCRVVLAVRDDFLGEVARVEDLRRHLASLIVLGPMGTAAIERAITGPLRRVGYDVDTPELIGRIVHEVRALPSPLPLLQFAAQALWEQRDRDRRLLLGRVYDELGGVAGALASHASRFVRSLGPDDVALVKAMALRLVTPEGTRRPRALAHLLEGLAPRTQEVLDRLLSQRLVVSARDVATGEVMVELAHEALAREWSELARWIEASREERLLIHEVEEAARLWERRGRREEETWTGDALEHVTRRLGPLEGELPHIAREFLQVGTLRAVRARRRRQLGWGAGGALLLLVSIAAVASAFEFRRREQVAIAQAEQIRLAAADVGAFELRLSPLALDPKAGGWAPAKVADCPGWKLWQADPNEQRAPTQGEPLRAVVVHPSQRVAGGCSQKVEAPGGAAWLVIDRGGCAPSIVRLTRLPGYATRAEQLPELSVSYPTCESSKVGMVALAGGKVHWPPELAPEDAPEVAPFAIDQTEVTNAQFRPFEQLSGLTGFGRLRPPGEGGNFKRALEDDVPVTGVHAFTAEAFCRWLGKELPSTVQWKAAFRSLPPLRPEQANLQGPDPFSGAAPVRSFPADRTPEGVFDLAGNVAEWTRTESTEFTSLRELAGGRWGAPAQMGQHQWRWLNNNPPQRPDFDVGFRCVRAQAAAEPELTGPGSGSPG